MRIWNACNPIFVDLSCMPQLVDYIQCLNATWQTRKSKPKPRHFRQFRNDMRTYGHSVYVLILYRLWISDIVVVLLNNCHKNNCIKILICFTVLVKAISPWCVLAFILLFIKKLLSVFFWQYHEVLFAIFWTVTVST